MIFLISFILAVCKKWNELECPTRHGLTRKRKGRAPRGAGLRAAVPQQCRNGKEGRGSQRITPRWARLGWLGHLVSDAQPFPTISLTPTYNSPPPLLRFLLLKPSSCFFSPPPPSSPPPFRSSSLIFNFQARTLTLLHSCVRFVVFRSRTFLRARRRPRKAGY